MTPASAGGWPKGAPTSGSSTIALMMTMEITFAEGLAPLRRAFKHLRLQDRYARP